MDLLSATILLVTVGIGVTCSVLRLLVILDSCTDLLVEACFGMVVDTVDRLISGTCVEVVARGGRDVFLTVIGLDGLTVVVFALTTRLRP